MKKLLLLTAAIAASLTLSGCIPDVSGDTNNDYSTSTVTDSYNNTYDVGTLLMCEGSTCEVAPAGTDEGDADAVVGEFNVEYTQAACTEAGFFFCTIEQVCLDVATDSGSCPNGDE